MQDRIFRDPECALIRCIIQPEPAMELCLCLIGIAARKSIESGRPIRISELTNLEPRAERLV